MTHLSLVLIDDDPLVHMVWKMWTKKYPCPLTTYSSFREAMAALEQNPDLWPLDAHVFVDSSLSGEDPGELLAKGLFERGYQNLYLVTGHPAHSFPPLPWIKAILGKEPPQFLLPS